MSYLYKNWLIALIWIYCQFISHLSSDQYKDKSWHVGRVPPSKFEYGKLNGFYSAEMAQKICNSDIRCGGFTFKGTKTNGGVKEIYFFHVVYDDTSSLQEYIKYPHWTTYIVTSRDYIVLPGEYFGEYKNVSSSIENE